MKKLAVVEGSEILAKFLSETKQEWFKTEVLQDYTPEDECPSLRTWLSGKKEEALKLLKEEAEINEWSKELGLKKFKKVRLHIVQKPFTSYLEWELQHYRYVNIPQGGEEVYLVPKEQINHLSLPDGDFHIFDNERVIKNTYAPHGQCITMDIYEKGEDISYFLNLKQQLLQYKEALS